MDKILKVAKRLKTFTLEDIVMFCDITSFGNKFEYIETVRTEDKFKIIDKNIPCKNSDITVVAACEMFLENYKSKDIKINTIKAYKTFINAHIIPYFRNYKLKDIMVTDVENFRKVMQNKQISERRIKNILTLLNQIIKYFQGKGFIDKTCVFEVKRIADIPKRQIQILTPVQLMHLFKILKKKYTYLLPIVQNLITLKQPLNTILTGSEQEKKHIKCKIRKDFYKIKQELGLTNYLLDDLRFSNFV